MMANIESNTQIPKYQNTEQMNITDTSFNGNTTTEVTNDWLLPDGVHDVLFAEADKQAYLRHHLVEQLQLRGYQLVSPPLIEFTESLLVNASEDLKRQTFKIIDQLSGRLMGVRADITPQISRIDANYTSHDVNINDGSQSIARYCYAGHVIHTLPIGLFGLRTPLQLGAEIFGTDSLQAEFELFEVVSSLLATLNLSVKVHFDLGHVSIFKRLVELAELSHETVEQLRQLYENKALPELKLVCASLPMGDDFYKLACYGHDLTTLFDQFSDRVKDDDKIRQAIHELQQLKADLQVKNIADISVDVADLSGYHYHTGMVFTVYLDGSSQPLVRGGRFDGSTHSRNQKNTEVTTRPAVGFSLDVTHLLSFYGMQLPSVVLVDFASLQVVNERQNQHMNPQAMMELHKKVAELREQDYRVVIPLTENDLPRDTTHTLVFMDDEWQLESYTNPQK